MIFQYTLDKQKAPQSLDDLKTAEYTRRNSQGHHGQHRYLGDGAGRRVIMSLDQTDTGGIIGVHSGSNQIGSDGTAYSTW